MLKVEYIAGFFDGEGSIGVYKSSNEQYYLRTQLTQNYTKHSSNLFEELVNTYGGHYTINESLSKKPFFNWQLGGDTALNFLKILEPYLYLKKEQAQLAIAWQHQKPKPTRDEKGRYNKYSGSIFDGQVALLLKMLKSQDLEVVMEAQKSLVDIVHTLNQVLNVKG